MHLRRALLLFAIVLGLAALATSVSRPQRESEGEPSTPLEPHRAEPRPPSDGAAEVSLPGPRGRRTATVRSGQAATLLVSVREAGDVELARLGLSAPAEPLTPARFELLAGEPGVHRVRFIPAGGGEPRDYGRLVIR